MIIYSNSCSFGLPPQKNPPYSTLIAEKLSASVINCGRGNSCNRRIIRTSLRDLIELKQKSNDRILVLMGLSDFFRTELWQPNIPAVDNDGNFHPLSVKTDYRIKNFYSGNVDEVYNNTDHSVRDYYRQWLLHQSKEALMTDLVTDIIMFVNWCQHNNINCLVWNNAKTWPDIKEVNYEDIFLKSLSQTLQTNLNVIDPWNFSFVEWALSLGHRPYDEDRYGEWGHPGPVAHRELAQHLLNVLDERNIL